jgi:GNAT superfamily N-acetyltransferase
MEFVRDRLGPGFEPQESIFATEGAFEEAGAAFLVLYDGERPIGCGGVRMLSADVAEIKRMFVTGTERRRGHGRRLLGELERLAAAAGARRVRLLTTEALREALELYADAGYREVEAFERDGRRDAWLEKPLTMEVQ